MSRRAAIPIRSTEQLGRIFVKANRTQRQYLVDMLTHYQCEFEQAAEVLDNETGEYPTAESLAFSVHETLDDFMTTFMAQDANAQEVRCQKGCSPCCHLHVTIDKHEAVLLLEHAREAGLALDFDLLRRQQGKTLPQWTRQPRADQACVFLGDMGECRVYEHRPNSCRKYHVVSPPEHCDTHSRCGRRCTYDGRSGRGTGGEQTSPMCRNSRLQPRHVGHGVQDSAPFLGQGHLSHDQGLEVGRLSTLCHFDGGEPGQGFALGVVPKNLGPAVLALGCPVHLFGEMSARLRKLGLQLGREPTTAGGHEPTGFAPPVLRQYVGHGQRQCRRLEVAVTVAYQSSGLSDE